MSNKLIRGKQQYGHFFGGETWELPLCCNCKENFHQIITLDLEDPRLNEIAAPKERTFPLPKVEFHLEELDECENPTTKELYDENIEKIGGEHIFGGEI